MRSRVVTILIVVVLGGGGCSATTTTTTTAPAPLVQIELTADGLGDVMFGIDPATVIAEISARFGGADFDSDWMPAESNVYGSCPGETMRAVAWGSLTTIFVDDDSSELGGWFYTYTYGYDYAENEGGIDPRGLNLRTDRGIGLGSTVADLRAAYGQQVIIDGDAALDVWSFVVDGEGMRGLLSGSQDDAVVTLLEPLTGCH